MAEKLERIAGDKRTIINLSEYIVPEVAPSVCYVPNFISAEEESDVIRRIESAPLPKWTQLSHRRLQNWGGIPHPKGMIAEDIPNWLREYMDKVSVLGVFGEKKLPNHVLINEYLAGQGIMAHSDGPLFHPIITTISCGSHTLLDFYKRVGTESVADLPELEFSLLVEPRSLLILQENLYHNYLHAIAERKSDIVNGTIKNLSFCSQEYKEGEILERGTRLSLTIRHVPKTSKLKLRLGK